MYYRDSDYYKEFYGEEWLSITTKAKLYYGFKCTKCGNKFKSKNLDVHHVTPITWFLDEGFDPIDDEHKCFGVTTKKPWHTQDNIIVLCMKCHSTFHPHLVELYKKQDFHR